MEDNKDLLNSNDLTENDGELSEDSFPVEKAEENTNDELNAELEQIAQTFREELAKTQSEFESEEKTEEAESGNEENETPDEALISEEDLCARCGVNERDKAYGDTYEYCEECRKKMLRNPLGFSNILIALLVFVMAGLSVVTFTNDVEGYMQSYKAKKLKSENRLDSALIEYDNAISYFSSKNIDARDLYLESAEVIFRTMPDGTTSMDAVSDRISKALDSGIYKLPIYKKSVDLRNESLMLYGTMQEIYNIVNSEKYTQFSMKDEAMYKTLMSDVESLIGKALSIKTLDGKSEMEMVVNEGVVRFWQYMFAYTTGDTANANRYLKMVYELEPEYLWLYAYEYAMVQMEKGEYEEASAIAEKILENNVEEADGYNILCTLSRINGEHAEALEWVEKGIEYAPTDVELLRAKAMTLVAAGEIEKAKTVIDEALAENAYGMLYFTAIVIENELGNKEVVDEMIMTIENGGLALTEKMKDYLNGKITAEQMFTEGSGDVE